MPGTRRQGRSVVLVNAVISVGIVAAIAGVSVVRKPPAPPTIAEFAPANPARQLTAEPSPLAARNGGSPAPTGPLPTPSGEGVPSALQCWAWPEGVTTQTFDRQSPPCISSWAAGAGNGGPTSNGVSGTEVRIGVPAAAVGAWQPYADFFSRHYQLYGRTLRLVPLGIVDLDTAEGQRAGAGAASERGVFAALDQPGAFQDAPPDLAVYVDTLADKKVVGVLTGSTQASTTALSAQAPYAWTYPPAMDTMQRMLAAADCRELSGHHASHSKQTRSRNRRFGVLVPAAKANNGRSFDASSLTAGFERCHVSAGIHEYDPADRLGVERVLADARREGVTTLIPFAGARVVAGALMGAAQRVGYSPEWLMPGLGQQRAVASWSRAPKEQIGSLFGVASWSRASADSTPAAQALHEVAPAVEFGVDDQAVYDGLALIAAGVQLAGPRLTPQAFADGLESATFANPGAGAAPEYQPSVGFQDVDHAMVDDFAQVWWNGTGFCMVGNGRRWTADQLPYDDPGFFNRDRGC
jgi:hypothetical protein